MTIAARAAKAAPASAYAGRKVSRTGRGFHSHSSRFAPRGDGGRLRRQRGHHARGQVGRGHGAQVRGGGVQGAGKGVRGGALVGRERGAVAVQVLVDAVVHHAVPPCKTAPRVRGRKHDERWGRASLGYEGTKVRRYEGTKVRRYEGTKVRRYEGTKVRRYEGTKVRRCEGAKVRRCEGAKVRRCEGAKVRRCEGAKVRRCEGRRYEGTSAAAAAKVRHRAPPLQTAPPGVIMPRPSSPNIATGCLRRKPWTLPWTRWRERLGDATAWSATPRWRRTPPSRSAGRRT